MRYILSSKGSIECAVIATWEITFINALDPIGTVAIGLYIVSLLYIEKIKQLTPLNFNIYWDICMWLDLHGGNLPPIASKMCGCVFKRDG